MLFKEIVDGRTHGRTHGRTTDNGRRTLKDHKSSLSTSCSGELITPDLPFLNIHNPFTNERISVYLDKHICMYLDPKDDFVKQISHLSKGMVIVATALCQMGHYTFTRNMADVAQCTKPVQWIQFTYYKEISNMKVGVLY